MEGNLENNQAMYMLKGKVVEIPLRDETLTKAGCYADAKVVGDAFKAMVKSGDYVGNATHRIVSTNGTGGVLVVYCSTHTSFVVAHGALVFKLSDGTASWIDGTEVLFANGDLEIKAENDAFNATGTTYYYQAI